LVLNHASCFFFSLAWLVNQDEWARIVPHIEALNEGYQTEFDLVNANLFLLVHQLHIEVWAVSALGEVRLMSQALGGLRRYLVLVPLDDENQFRPHWLPATSLSQRRVPWTPEDLEALAPGGAPRPEVPEGQRERLAAMWVAHAAPPVLPEGFGDVDEPLVGANAPMLADEFELAEIPEVYGYVCERTPPYHPRPGDEGVLPKLWTTPTSRVRLTAQQLVLMSDPRPDGIDRGLSRVTIGRVGIMWEFRPDVVIREELGEGDWMFTELDEPAHPQDPDLNSVGQYNVNRVTSLQCDGVVFRLGNQRIVRLAGITYGLWQLEKVGVRNFFKMFLANVPFMTFPLLHVTTVNPRDEMPNRRDLPTETAFVKAAYLALQKQVNPETVAALNMCRNEELAIDGGSGRDPADVARALEQMRRNILQTWPTLCGQASPSSLPNDIPFAFKGK
jgi:hypothetical protein